jgi:hypothetical protein
MGRLTALTATLTAKRWVAVSCRMLLSEGIYRTYSIYSRSGNLAKNEIASLPAEGKLQSR